MPKNRRFHPYALTHPPFRGSAGQNLTPQLFLSIQNSKIRGHIGLGKGDSLSHHLKAAPELLRLAGFRLDSLPEIINDIEGGSLHLGLKGVPIVLGAAFRGTINIRGDLAIAAQPFLGLSGDLFVEIGAPWWSPVPDKKWTWPLGNKEWPIGGSFGIGATTILLVALNSP